MAREEETGRAGGPPVHPMVAYALGLAQRQGAGEGVLRRLLRRLLRRRTPSPRDFVEFDGDAYLLHNPDVREAAIPPLSHFAKTGWLEGRALSHRLDTRQYLAANATARQALLDLYRIRNPQAPLSSPPPFRADGPRQPGLLLVGYVEAGLGLGESSRGLARALAAQGFPFAIHPYNVSVEGKHLGPFMPERYSTSGRWQATLFEANGDQLPDFLDRFPHALQGGHAIFRTYWELAEAPRTWARDLRHFDELWAPTAFVARAFRSVFDGPITVVPPCVAVEPPGPVGRARFGLPDDRFLFLFTFDYNSLPARKNPLGLVEAFQAAFPDPGERVGLVLKAMGTPDHSPEMRRTLARAAAADPRLVVVDEAWPREKVLALVRACDAYVSLHRSEGFGYGMAEAMALGRPVAGTDYSGSVDFLSDETGYPVPFTLRPLRKGEYPHEGGQSWAEPDLAAAATILRRMREDAPGRERRSAAGQRFVEERYGVEGVGRIAAARLREALAPL